MEYISEALSRILEETKYTCHAKVMFFMWIWRETTKYNVSVVRVE
jgi:hypothetical protein